MNVRGNCCFRLEHTYAYSTDILLTGLRRAMKIVSGLPAYWSSIEMGHSKHAVAAGKTLSYSWSSWSESTTRNRLPWMELSWCSSFHLAQCGWVRARYHKKFIFLYIWGLFYAFRSSDYTQPNDRVRNELQSMWKKTVIDFSPYKWLQNLPLFAGEYTYNKVSWNNLTAYLLWHCYEYYIPLNQISICRIWSSHSGG
jgi:hypothetical protein